MTLKQQIIDDVGDVFLNTDEFADVLTYTPPLGGTPRDVTGIWDLKEPHTDKKNGLEVIHSATFVVAAAEVFAREGIVTVDGTPWVVTEVGEPIEGMRTVMLTRQGKIRTGSNGKKFGP